MSHLSYFCPRTTTYCKRGCKYDCVLAAPRWVTKETELDMEATNPKAERAVADGKAPLEYLDPATFEAEAYVLKHGAERYGLRNYRDTPILLSTYVGAIERHLLAMRRGEDIDPDSGQPHWAHIRADCAVIAGAQEAGTAIDDRTTKESKAARCAAVLSEARTAITDARAALDRQTPEPFVVDVKCCMSGGDIGEGCTYIDGGLCCQAKWGHADDRLSVYKTLSSGQRLWRR